MSPKIISIEGNIGSGKSTIIHNLEKKLENSSEYIFLREPVDIWETIKDKENRTILEKFYQNTEKYAFAFQVMAYATRSAILQDAITKNPNCKYILCERSLEADNHIFAKMLNDDEKMEKVEYEIYEYFYKTRKQDMNLDAVIYIDATADVCLNRIKKRDRNGETNISLNYLESCRNYHNNWLLKNKEEDIKLLHINTNKDATYNYDDKNDIGFIWMNTIEEFIKQL
jgi:deoxycitidine kinase/deoxyguanosine kinase